MLELTLTESTWKNSCGQDTVWTGRAAQVLWVAQAVHKDDASYIPRQKYPFIHRAVLNACDRLNSVEDGVLEDPMRCKSQRRKWR
jgi:hypothetical protein